MRKAAPLLDTNVIIDILNGNKNALEYAEGLSTLLVPAVAVFEVLVGCTGKRKNQKKKALQIFDACEIVEFSQADAVYASELYIKKPIDKHILDYFIAGTANTNSLEVATRNTQDFKAVQAFEPYKL